MKLIIIASTAALLSQALPAVAQPQVKWINSLNTSAADGPTFLIGKCANWLITEVCPSNELIQGQIKAGSSVNGMKIGAIRCEYQPETVKG